MKKKIILSLFAILVVGLLSCMSTSSRRSYTKGRIILKDETYIDGYPHYIIEVDGVEYLTSYYGGIYPLVK